MRKAHLIQRTLSGVSARLISYSLWTTFAEGRSSTWTTFDLQLGANFGVEEWALCYTDLGLKEESTSFLRRQYHIAGSTVTRSSSTGGGVVRRATLFQSSSPASEPRLSLPVLSDLNLKSILKVCVHRAGFLQRTTRGGAPGSALPSRSRGCRRPAWAPSLKVLPLVARITTWPLDYCYYSRHRPPGNHPCDTSFPTLFSRSEGFDWTSRVDVRWWLNAPEPASTSQNLIKKIGTGGLNAGYESLNV
jgi:hypothetical protein